MRANSFIRLLFPVLLLCSGCNLVDTSSLDVETWPSGRDEIIGGTAQQIWMEFSQRVDRDSVEEALSLSTIDGHILYDTTWKGSRILLSPVEPWQTGQRYFFTCKGTVKTPDSTSFLVDIQVPFYVDTNTRPPVLLSFSPDEDSVVPLTESVTLRFSMPLRAQDLEKYIRIAPDHDITITLSDDAHTITITPDIPWTGLTRYEWTVNETLTGVSGTPVLETRSGSFRTLVDLDPPEEPVCTTRSIHDETAPFLPLAQLGKDRGIVASYNEAVDFVSFRESITIDPEISLQHRMINSHAFLFFPEDGLWDPGQEYTITQKAGLKDLSGNRTKEPFVVTVTPSTPELGILEVTNTPPWLPEPDSFTGDDMRIADHVHPIAIDTDTWNEHTFIITLSGGLTAAEAQRLVSAILLEPLFPYYLGNPELKTVIFDPATDDHTIRLNYTNMDVPHTGIPEERVFYRLLIDGGKTGFTTDEGSFFTEDLSIILEAFEKD